MNISLFTKLFQDGLITGDELNKVSSQKDQPVSVHYELRTLLYLGIVLLTTAIGILVYKNIDTIGHTALLTVIGAASVLCFGHCIKHSKGYSNTKMESPDVWFDYALLLGCLLLLTFIGYIQFQYNVFGIRWGLALFIPMVVLFYAAYYFDHLGVLSLAITNLAAWAGITVTPLRILKENDFSNATIMYTGFAVGFLLVAASYMSRSKNIKAHFEFTYKNFGAHILFISLLALMFYYDNIYFVWFVALAAIAFLFFKDALKENSFYFLVITLLYAYIALSYVVVRFLTDIRFDTGGVYIIFLYFIISGIVLIRLFIYYNKIIKQNAGI